MDDDFLVTVYVVVDETLRALAHRDHPLAVVSDAKVLTVAVVAAKHFQNHHALALATLQRQGYLSGALSASRFNRRLHALGDWFRLLLEALAELLATGDCFLIDSMPVPACRRARAGRCRTVRGRTYCGVCPAKGEKVRGTRVRVGRLHLVCTTGGILVAFDLLPAGLPGALWAVTPIYELTHGLPAGATVYGDKGLATLAERLRDDGEQSASIQDELARREARLAALIGERDVILTLYRKGRITEDALDRQLAALTTEEAAVKADLLAVRARRQSAEAQAGQLRSAETLLCELWQRLGDGVAWEIKRQLVELLVEQSGSIRWSGKVGSQRKST